MTAIKQDELVFGNILGSGGFGVVWKGSYKGDVVAIKRIRGNIENQVNKIMNEAMYLTLVNGHENIVKLFGISIGNDATYLVMEYLEGGSLWHLMHTDKHITYTIADAIIWLRQAAQGLNYLYSVSERGVIHRDVKPLNMLLDGERKILKICDFGFVRNEQTQMTEKRGTPIYMAPEVFKGRKYTGKCDVYSMGITMWEVIVRKMPYGIDDEKVDNLTLLRRIDVETLRPSLDKLTEANCPDRIQKLIQKCWDKDANSRPTMQDILDVLKES